MRRHDLVDRARRQCGHRGVGAHATGVGAGVAVAHSLEVLGRGQARARRVPSQSTMQRALRRRRAPLRSPRCVPAAAEGRAAQLVDATSPTASSRSRGHEHALAGREPVGLDHVGRLEGAQERRRRARVVEDAVARRSARPTRRGTPSGRPWSPRGARRRRRGPRPSCPGRAGRSASPSTRGCSGPMTKRSASSSVAACPRT